MSDVTTAHEDLERAEAGVHHAAEGGGAVIPLSIAIMAVIAAVLGSLESASSARAVVARSTAAIRQGEATDEWAFYQAASVKKNLYDLFAQTGGANAEALREKSAKYGSDQADIETRAREKEAQVKIAEQESETAMEQHHHLIIATNLVHLAIALASVSMLVRRRFLWLASLACVCLGMTVGALAAEPAASDAGATMQSSKMTFTPVGDRQIVATRIFHGTPERVIAVWTQPDLLKQWVGGPGVTLVTCVSEPKVGGRFRYEIEGANGMRAGMGGFYREIVPGKRVVRTEIHDGYPVQIVNSAEFVAKDGNTLATITLTYASREERDGMTKGGGMEQGVGQSYDRIDQVVQSK